MIVKALPLLCIVAMFAIVPLPRKTVSAQGPSVAARAHGASRIVVAQVESVVSRFEVNEFGDQVIRSHVTLRVSENLKGKGSPQLDVVLDGGTVGDITLMVSDLPVLVEGDRGVFFLDESGVGTDYKLHGRGHGLERLGSSQLDTLRTQVRDALEVK